MPKPRPNAEKLRPLSMRMPAALLGWLAAEAQRRKTQKTAVLRDLLADARDCFGIPPLLQSRIAEAAREQRLSIRDYIAELLRCHAKNLRPGADERSVRGEDIRGSGDGHALGAGE